MSSDFAPGDLVVCVEAGSLPRPDGPTAPMLHEGRAYTITKVWIAPPGYRDSGLAIVRVLEADPDGYPGFAAERFRKIDKSDEGFATWMRSMRPAPSKVREAA